MITRVRFSPAISFFAKGFIERWELTPYYSTNQPCIFIGCYTDADVDLIFQHPKEKIVMLLGGDLPNFDKLKHDKSIRFVSDKRHILNLYKDSGVNYFDGVIPLKTFKGFKPTTKGDKIYIYVNRGTPGHIAKHGLEKHKWLITHFGHDRFIFGVHGKSESEVIRDYYTPSFINLQLNPVAGFTSSLEMAHMGRKTVSNTDAPFAIPFLNENDIICAIENEAKNKDFDSLIGDYLDNSHNWHK